MSDYFLISQVLCEVLQVTKGFDFSFKTQCNTVAFDINISHCEIVLSQNLNSQCGG